MTKNIFITAVAVLLSVALCPLWAQNVSEDCKVGEFSAINLRSVTLFSLSPILIPVGWKVLLNMSIKQK